jgi:hypothetical protein
MGHEVILDGLRPPLSESQIVLGGADVAGCPAI